MRLLVLFLATVAMAAPPDSGAAMKRLFRDPPVEFSSAPLLVWNGAVTEAAIDRMLDDLNGQRVRGLFIHPRPGLITPYLTEEWFKLVRYTVDGGARRGMHVWLYDENSYPSGFAGGNVTAAHPETYNQGQGLVLRRLRAGESADCAVRQGENCFERVGHPVRAWTAGFPYVDLIKPGVTETFIETTMKGYERAIGAEFGKRVPGIFTDEPDISPPVAKSMRWTPDLFEQFEKRWGYDLRPHLLSLWEQTGDWRKVRHNYYGLLLELFVERWSKPWYGYTEKKKLTWTGHYWEHEWPNPRHGADSMAMYAWHQMPGIDMLFNQWAEGVNAQFGNVRAVKELASVANQLGRRRALSETYGGGGWSLRLEDMKRLGDWQYALGVNFLNQHLSFQTMVGVRKYDYPQSFSYHASWWGQYGVLGRYFERLSLALSAGREVNDVLVLEPTTSAWSYAAVPGADKRLMELGESFQQFVTALSKAHVGYDLACENIVKTHGSVKGAGFAVGERTYSLVVLPPGTENLDAPTAKLLEAYLRGGGKVLSFVDPPSRVDGAESNAVREMAAKYAAQWRRAAGFDAALFPAVPVETLSGEFYLMRRVVADGEVLFAANPSLEKEAGGRVKGDGVLEELNAFQGEVTRHGAEFRLAPGGSLLLFRGKSSRAVEKAAAPQGQARAVGEMDVRRLSPNTLKLDYCDVAFGGKELRGVYFFKASDEVFRHYGFAEGNPWHTAVQFQSKIVERDKFPAGSGFTASFAFEAGAGVDMASLQAVVERPSIFKVRINGVALEPLPGVWWTDREFAVYAIGKHVKAGRNVVSVTANPMSVFAELEPVILRGEFGVEPAAAGWRLTAAGKMGVGSWKQQGLPLYGEVVSYRRSFAVEDVSRAYAVRLGRWFGTVAEVRVNGLDAGVIAWQPYELDVSKLLRKGVNEVEVRVHGSLKNVYGPHHGNVRKGFAGPHMMRFAPEAQPAGSKYDLDDFGLFDAFEMGESRPMAARYRLIGTGGGKASAVGELTVTAGVVEAGLRWTQLAAVKQNGERYTLWMQSEGEPSRGNVKRYLFQDARMRRAREYRDARTRAAVMPSHGGWEQLRLPVTALPETLHYLGHDYRRESVAAGEVAVPSDVEMVELRPDLYIGQASNTKQKDETRRWDGSDYELVPLAREDYRTMKEAGITVVRVNDAQWQWADELGLYFWGGLKESPYPEILYRANYIGPALFLDEPAVGTRDHVVRPRLAKDAAYRKALSPQVMLEEFGGHFGHALEAGPPWALMKSLRARADVDVGDMNFAQQNLYTWETMVSTAAYQLSQEAGVPEAFVFEPPGRIGARRTLPEIDMTYGVQFPPDDPKALTSILFGFLRGAARVTAKQWGVSIYGAVDRSDAPFWLTHAYDLGATRFFFWDNYQLACVPFGEVLGLARHLRDHARAHPRGDWQALRKAARAAVLLPPGYDLGHVQTGKGNLWGINELHLERINARRVSYRTVMSRFFAEVERLFRSGESFDLLWDLQGLDLSGYATVVRVHEDGKVERREGKALPPRLTVTLSAAVDGTGLAVTAKGRVEETASKVFYTFGTDSDGVYRNALVAWEVHGPEVEDQVPLLPERLKPRVELEEAGGTAEVTFAVTRAGNYKVRAATVDTAGRSTVVWHPFRVVKNGDGRLVLE
ncbi:MAG: hypothetical protein JNK48_11980 [Bryobacterales bacterium]|nr:hypothetical protein [Bryobacterales bacterium]